MNESTPGKSLPPNESSESILLVDDDEVFRERLARALRDRAYDVRTAGNYDQAVATATHDSPEIAIVDLRMPKVSGLELVPKLKEIDPATRVFVLTAYGSIATAVEAIRRGAEDYLTKPADAEQIIARFQGEAPDEAEVSTPSLAQVEWEHIQRVLSDADGNISEASRRLGIHRRSLQRKLQKYAPR